uniref:Uncharacterized protein n=1 Tax=Panagrellus redivivus TaxID=6233 RepID=A0A7E4ZY57_PANRE
MSVSDGSPPFGDGVLEDDSHFLNDASLGGASMQEAEEEDPIADEEPLDPGGEAEEQLFSIYDGLARRMPFELLNNQGYFFSADSGVYDVRRFARLPALEEFLNKSIQQEFYARDYQELGYIARIGTVDPDDAEKVRKIFKGCSNFDRDLAIIKTAESLGDPRLCQLSFPDFSYEELSERFDFIVQSRTVLKVLGRHFSLMPPSRKDEFMANIPFDVADTNKIMNTKIPLPYTYDDLWDLQNQLSQPYDVHSILRLRETFETTGSLITSRQKLLSQNFSMNKTFLVNDPLHLVLRYLTSGSFNHSQKVFNKFYKFMELDGIYHSELETPPSLLYTVYFQQQTIEVSHLKAFFFSNGETLFCRTSSVTKCENMAYLIAFAISIDASSRYCQVSNLSPTPLIVNGDCVGPNLYKTVKFSDLIYMFSVNTMDDSADPLEFVVVPNPNNDDALTWAIPVSSEKVKKRKGYEYPEDVPVKKKSRRKEKKRKQELLKSQELPIVPQPTPQTDEQPTSEQSAPQPAPPPKTVISVTINSRSPSPEKKKISDDFLALKDNHWDRVIRPVENTLKAPPEKFSTSTPLPKEVVFHLNEYLRNFNHDFAGLDERWKAAIKYKLADCPKMIEEVKPKRKTNPNPDVDNAVESCVYEDISSQTLRIAIPSVKAYAGDADLEGDFKDVDRYRRLTSVIPIDFRKNKSPKKDNSQAEEGKPGEAEEDPPEVQSFILHPRKLVPGDSLDKVYSNLDWYKEKDRSFNGFARKKKVPKSGKTHTVPVKSAGPENAKPAENDVDEDGSVNETDFMVVNDDGLKCALVPLTLTGIPSEQCLDQFEGDYELRLPEGGGAIVADDEQDGLFVVDADKEEPSKARLRVGYDSDIDEEALVAPGLVVPKEQFNETVEPEYYVGFRRDESGNLVSTGDKRYYLNGDHYIEVSNDEITVLNESKPVTDSNAKSQDIIIENPTTLGQQGEATYSTVQSTDIQDSSAPISSPKPLSKPVEHANTFEPVEIVINDGYNTSNDFLMPPPAKKQRLSPEKQKSQPHLLSSTMPNNVIVSNGVQQQSYVIPVSMVQNGSTRLSNRALYGSSGFSGAVMTYPYTAVVSVPSTSASAGRFKPKKDTTVYEVDGKLYNRVPTGKVTTPQKGVLYSRGVAPLARPGSTSQIIRSPQGPYYRGTTPSTSMYRVSSPLTSQKTGPLQRPYYRGTTPTGMSRAGSTTTPLKTGSSLLSLPTREPGKRMPTFGQTHGESRIIAVPVTSRRRLPGPYTTGPPPLQSHQTRQLRFPTSSQQLRISTPQMRAPLVSARQSSSQIPANGVRQVITIQESPPSDERPSTSKQSVSPKQQNTTANDRQNTSQQNGGGSSNASKDGPIPDTEDKFDWDYFGN